MLADSKLLSVCFSWVRSSVMEISHNYVHLSIIILLGHIKISNLEKRSCWEAVFAKPRPSSSWDSECFVIAPREVQHLLYGSLWGANTVNFIFILRTRSEAPHGSDGWSDRCSSVQQVQAKLLLLCTWCKQNPGKQPRRSIRLLEFLLSSICASLLKE